MAKKGRANILARAVKGLSINVLWLLTGHVGWKMKENSTFVKKLALPTPGLDQWFPLGVPRCHRVPFTILGGAAS